MGLAAILVITRLLQVTETIMSCSRLRANLQTGEFPAAYVLKDGCNGKGALVADEILDHYRVLAGCAGKRKLCATRTRAFGSVNSTKKRAVRIGIRTAIEQKGSSQLRLG